MKARQITARASRKSYTRRRYFIFSRHTMLDERGPIGRYEGFTFGMFGRIPDLLPGGCCHMTDPPKITHTAIDVDGNKTTTQEQPPWPLAQ